MGAGIGIALTTPEGFIIEQSFTLGLQVSTNEAEYAAVLTGLQMSSTLGVTGLEVQCAFSLVVN